MYIVIAGAGLIGGELAHSLVESKHDVVVIDRDKEICDRLYAEIGVIAINGNAASIETLKEAGIEKADVVVAAMGNDVDNLACAILAKSFDVSQVVARMRDHAYENAYRLAGVTSIVRVTDLMINEMMMEIEQPVVRRMQRIMTIGSGRGEVFMVNIPQGAKVAGKSVKEITKSSKFPIQCVFFAAYNHEAEEFFFPRGDYVVNEADQVFLVSPAENVKRAADFLTDIKQRRFLRD